MKLSLDTTSDGPDKISLTKTDHEDLLHVTLDQPGESFAGTVIDFLNTNQVNTNSIKGINVATGPGNRFTRTRMGVTVANAIAFALSKPVNNQDFVVPSYHQAPNITPPKSKL